MNLSKNNEKKLEQLLDCIESVDVSSEFVNIKFNRSVITEIDGNNILITDGVSINQSDRIYLNPVVKETNPVKYMRNLITKLKMVSLAQIGDLMKINNDHLIKQTGSRNSVKESPDLIKMVGETK